MKKNRNGDRESLKIILPTPPKIFYTDGFRDYLASIVDACDGDKSRAAELLGISVSHLRNLINGRGGMGAKTCRGAGVSYRKQFYLPGAVKERR